MAYKKPGRFYQIDGLSLPSVTTILSVIAKPQLINWASYSSRDNTIDAAIAQYQAFAAAGSWVSNTSFKAAILKHLGKRPAHLSKSDEAIDIGTLVHARVEAEMRRELGQDVALPEVPEQEIVNGMAKAHPAWSAYQAYLAWRRANEVKPLEVEKRLYSKRHGYAGTADFEGYVADKLTVADWKTSRGVYPEYRLQVAAYRTARYEMGPQCGVLGGLVLRFPKAVDDTFEAHDVKPEEQGELFGVFMAAHQIWRWENPDEGVFE
jgi:hypothetical protein